MAIRVPVPAHEEADDDAEGTEATTAVAFEDLWQHRAALRDLCQRIVGDAATADDVVQETYLRALRNLDRLEQRPSLMPWLATVARRRSIDELRRRQYQRPVEIMPDDSTKPEHDPGEAAAASETVRRVREALTALTDRERELLMQQVNQGLSLAQLAEIDESSVASVRSVLCRARTKLRDALTETGARVLAPLGLARAWFKRTGERLGDLSNRVETQVKHKLGEVNVKAQRVSPVMPGGYERFAEVATATAVAGALALGGALPVIGGSTPDGDRLTVELAGSAVVEVSGAPEAAAAASGRQGNSAANSPGSDRAEAGTEHGAANPEPAPSLTGPIHGPAVVPTPGSTAHPPAPPAAPRAPGSPTATPEEEPADPDDALIDDITYPGEGFSSSGGSTVFALGHYPGNCPDGGCDLLYRSSDGGATWYKLEAAGLDADSIAVAPNWPSDERIFAMGPQGLQVSNDGGETFGAPFQPGLYKGPMALSPAFEQDRKILIGEGGAYWRYRAGDQVARAGAVSGLSGDIAHFAFDPGYADSRLVFAGSTETSPSGLLRPGVWACEDGVCDSVDHLTDLYAAPQVFVSSTYAEDRLVAAWLDEYLYLSDSDVLDLQRVTNLPVEGTITAVSDDGLGTIYVAIDAAEPGGRAGIAKSADGGETWTLLGAGTPLASSVATLTATADGTVYAAPHGNAGSRGVRCSTDGGATWATRCD